MLCLKNNRSIDRELYTVKVRCSHWLDHEDGALQTLLKTEFYSE